MRHNIVTKRFRVLAALWIARASGRDTLNGIFRFVETHPNWQIVLVQSDAEFTPELVQTAKDRGFDGIIATIPGSEETLAALVETPLPVVVKNVRSPAFAARRGPTAFIYNDNDAIGRLAAATLLKNGRYASFAYVPEFDTDWCRDRGRGFEARLAEGGEECHLFTSTSSPAAPGSDIDGIAAFLAALPKPVAVYAATDQCATNVLAAAEAAKGVPPRANGTSWNGQRRIPRQALVHPNIKHQARPCEDGVHGREDAGDVHAQTPCANKASADTHPAGFGCRAGVHQAHPAGHRACRACKGVYRRPCVRTNRRHGRRGASWHLAQSNRKEIQTIGGEEYPSGDGGETACGDKTASGENRPSDQGDRRSLRLLRAEPPFPRIQGPLRPRPRTLAHPHKQIAFSIWTRIRMGYPPPR